MHTTNPDEQRWREKPLANPPIILTSRIFEESGNETSKRNDSDSSNNK